MQEFWQRPVLPQLAAEIEYVTRLMRMAKMRKVRIMTRMMRDMEKIIRDDKREGEGGKKE